VTARGIDVRAVLAKADRAETRGRLPLRARLEPRGEERMEWSFTPAHRGRLRVRLASVGSLFPFGFLRKDVGTDLATEAIVWPAAVEYRRHGAASPRRAVGGERVARAGSSGDLLALRRYTSGDSHRLIHWKASARTQTLLVRQLAAERAEGYSLWLRTEAGMWSRPEQFELLVSFAATLAEDLFRAGRLLGVAIDGEAPRPVRRGQDLEWFLDRLAVVRPTEEKGKRDGGVASPAGIFPVEISPAGIGGRKTVLTFAPDGARGVAAYVDGAKTASA
jgi:uncharacterized protein (DUF58 family)